MKFQIALPNYGDGSTPQTILEIAQASEELGYEAIGLADHVLVPRADPTRYERIFEPLTTLGFLAARTTHIKLMTSVIVLPMRNPFVVAKAAATLDVLSNGRLVLGLGVGWNEREFANIGASFKTRGSRTDEGIDLLRHLFSGSVEPFRGTYYHYEDGVFEPLPIRRVNLPILIGGNSEPALIRAARVADIWQSNLTDPQEFARAGADLRRRAGTRRIELGIRAAIGGEPKEMLANTRKWIDAGAEHLMLNFGLTQGYLEKMRLFAREVRPYVS